ncbi:alpha-2A adrenergic receptor-like [Mercenaria mercenaria]|uniref:alpha-2A adrenergic receptor-like n=1 Tax=Mercenaria mercenaria TaxID=6596 RepID=UPI00234EAAA2|nr:alpha-2A adrenergic receptor-like [Mercenaria mercenaria]XP_045189537.2 alpha-2A adrenergic receptor-like [Mercenaria mercenaria]
MNDTLNSSNADTIINNRTETLEQLNDRYAEALLPLTVTFGFFTLFGIFGNLIILLVFTLSRDYKRNNFKVFVLTLGVIDIITCCTLIPAEMVKQRKYFAFGDEVSCKVKCFFNVFVSTASCLALLVISVDRYRKVVQPFKKQLNPKLAVRLLFLVAFIFPLFLAIPGTMMCGIKRATMTNIYGGETEINLCETEDKYRDSIWRKLYKIVFIILLIGISCTYVILYAFVMKEATKQIRAIAQLRKNSTYEVTYSSDIYDPNAINPKINGSRSFEENDEEQDEKVAFQKRSISFENGSLNLKDAKKKKVSKQLSLRSMRSQAQMLRTQRFPTKTLVWFVLTIVFIITYMTHLVLALKVSDIVYMSPSEFSWFSFFFRFYFFNHMINPIVYAVFVKKFRESCRILLPTLIDRIRNVCICH